MNTRRRASRQDRMVLFSRSLAIGLVLFGALAATRSLAAPDGKVAETRAVTNTAVRLPSNVLAALASHARTGADLSSAGQPAPGARLAQVGRAAGQHAPAQAELIHEQKFEDAAFPPTGWRLFDAIADRAGKTEPDQAWSRETCDLDGLNGGKGAAWSVGGGNVGKSQRPCSGYAAAVENYLIFDNIDTNNYQGGLRVNLRFKIDVPRLQTFQICASNNDSTTTFSCSYPVATSYAQWTTFNNWLVFPKASDMNNASIILYYKDDSPDGTHLGAYIDNMRIEALFEAPVPTDTPTRRASVTPRPSNTPRVSATIQPRPSSTPTPTPDGRRAFLPVTQRDLKDEERVVPEARHVWVEFGTGVDRSSGVVSGRGTRFEYGTMQLCGKTEWGDLDAGAKVSWDFQAWNGHDFQSYEVPPFKDSLIVAAGNRSGFKSVCIGNQDPVTHAPTPLDVGKYRLVASLNDSETASQVAEIVPGAPTPTSPPTDEPTPGDTPEPEPTDESGLCRQRLVNGNFETGPVGWTLRSNTTKGSDISTVIVKDATNAFQGEWMALLGGGLNFQDDLHSTATIPLFEPGSIISASLTFAVAIDSEEVKDGKDDDILLPLWLSQDDKQDPILAAGVSEERLENRRWNTFTKPVDVTAQLTKREGWTSTHLVFLSRNNAVARTFHLVDDVRLTVCTPAVAARGRQAPARTGGAIGWFAPRGSLRPTGDALAISGPSRRWGDTPAAEAPTSTCHLVPLAP